MWRWSRAGPVEEVNNLRTWEGVRKQRCEMPLQQERREGRLLILEMS